MKHKILFVAMGFSIHAARWISQILDQGWEVYLFPVPGSDEIHELLLDKRIIILNRKFFYRSRFLKQNKLLKYLQIFRRTLYGPKQNQYRVEQMLEYLIKEIKPDIIHSMETQHAGYLVSEVNKAFSGRFPYWLHSFWGSDIYLFGRLKDHREKIRYLLSQLDHLITEGPRDEKLARDFGYQGGISHILVAGGFDLKGLPKKIMSPAKRKIIALKGYQGWSGRALVGIRALERCSDVLSSYEVVVHSVRSEDVQIAAELLAHSTGLKVRILPNDIPHQQMLKLFSQVKVSIGLGISDGVPYEMIESMLMGAFPIQSNTAATQGWISDNKTGCLVNPNDPQQIEKVLRKIVTSNVLLNKAARLNSSLIRKELEYSNVQHRVIALYKNIFAEITNENSPL